MYCFKLYTYVPILYIYIYIYIYIYTVRLDRCKQNCAFERATCADTRSCCARCLPGLFLSNYTFVRYYPITMFGESKGLNQIRGWIGWSGPLLSGYVWWHVFSWRGHDHCVKSHTEEVITVKPRYNDNICFHRNCHLNEFAVVQNTKWTDWYLRKVLFCSYFLS